MIESKYFVHESPRHRRRGRRRPAASRR
jgi:hypothetical protein